MKLSVPSTIFCLLSISATSSAFVGPAGRNTLVAPTFATKQSLRNSISGRHSSLLSLGMTDKDEEEADEIARLKSMAAKLRAEAAALEAERAEELAAAAEMAFQKFDINQDGEVSLAELKAGLEKTLKLEDIPESRVAKLMEDFDVSGDGALQLDEFVGTDAFRGRLEALVREEKDAARKAAEAAKAEEMEAKLAEARLEFLNEKTPTNSDKILSVLPYLFPLLDGLQFGRFLFIENQENPIVLAIAVLYSLYRSVPFGGFIAFLVLIFLSGNPSINRLVRFNLQQAIFLDIALIVPGLLQGVYSLILAGTGGTAAPIVVETGSDIVFFALLAAIAYSTVSSLLGVTPDKVPFLSDQVTQRMPTLDMFDEEGRFIPRQLREEEDEEKKDDK